MSDAEGSVWPDIAGDGPKQSGSRARIQAVAAAGLTPPLTGSPYTESSMDSYRTVAVQQAPRPLFPLGMRVKFDGYFGVSTADDTDPDNAQILSLRLIADIDDEWEDDCIQHVITYPRGWEYMLARIGQPHRECGWVGESELVRAGYTPPDELDDPRADAPATAGELAGLEVPTLEEVDAPWVGGRAG